MKKARGTLGKLLAWLVVMGLVLVPLQVAALDAELEDTEAVEVQAEDTDKTDDTDMDGDPEDAGQDEDSGIGREYEPDADEAAGADEPADIPNGEAAEDNEETEASETAALAEQGPVTTYEELVAAIENAEDDDTILIANDIELENTISISKSLTLQAADGVGDVKLSLRTTNTFLYRHFFINGNEVSFATRDVIIDGEVGQGEYCQCRSRNFRCCYHKKIKSVYHHRSLLPVRSEKGYAPCDKYFQNAEDGTYQARRSCRENQRQSQI